MNVQKILEADIEVAPRTQQEIDDYGPNGIDLMKFKDNPSPYPFLDIVRLDD